MWVKGANERLSQYNRQRVTFKQDLSQLQKKIPRSPRHEEGSARREGGWAGGAGQWDSVTQESVRQQLREGGRPGVREIRREVVGPAGPGLTPVNVLRVHSERQELSAGRGSSLIWAVIDRARFRRSSREVSGITGAMSDRHKIGWWNIIRKPFVIRGPEPGSPRGVVSLKWSHPSPRLHIWLGHEWLFLFFFWKEKQRLSASGSPG